MLARLLLIFILVPILELFLLIKMGQFVGTLPTIGLIIFTGALGAYLARRQGLQVLARVRTELQAGQLPTDSIFDGAIVLIAGALLMTPGILTDTVGFLCLIPASRRLIKKWIWSRIERGMRDGRIFVAGQNGRSTVNNGPEDIIILGPDDYSQSD